MGPATNCGASNYLNYASYFVYLDPNASQEFPDFDELATSSEMDAEELYSLLTDIAYEDIQFQNAGKMN